MNPQHRRRIREVFLVSAQGFLYVDLFELRYRFLQQYVAVQHLVYQRFQFRSQFLESSVPDPLKAWERPAQWQDVACQCLSK